jgi:hypothetical protein
MAIKKYQPILLFGFIVLVSMHATCNKRLDCARTVYGFELSIKAYPNKDSVRVADTIWLEIYESTTLKDGFTLKR